MKTRIKKVMYSWDSLRIHQNFQTTGNLYHDNLMVLLSAYNPNVITVSLEIDKQIWFTCQYFSMLDDLKQYFLNKFCKTSPLQIFGQKFWRGQHNLKPWFGNYIIYMETSLALWSPACQLTIKQKVKK